MSRSFARPGRFDAWSEILTIADEICFDEEADKELRDSHSKSPDVFAFDCGQLPFDLIGDAHFELILADIYRKQAGDRGYEWYDDARRLNDGADQGRDVILFKNSLPVGVIQCKRVKGNLPRATVIEELCKFFLYAHIRPEIASPKGESFRYIVAMADGAAGVLTAFMLNAGRERFDDLRKEFEKRALEARDGSKTLSEDPKLKGLTATELCDLVWERIDHLHTNMHKKDDLSNLVNKYPDIKRKYFRLESDSEGITEAIKKLLESRGVVVAAGEERFVSAVRTEYLRSRLGDFGEFNLALVQGSDLLTFLRAMLSPTNGTLMSKFGSRPVIVTGGAAAATVEDWSAIDELVQAYPYPLVLCLGCGVVGGDKLLEWKSSDDISWVEPSWLPSSTHSFKAGWCWVSVPGDDYHKCFVVVENEPGGGHDRGNQSLRLAFEDVIVWPTLSNDFTSAIEGGRSQLRRVMACQSEDKSRRPNLVLSPQHVDCVKQILKSASDYYAQRATSTIGIVTANSSRLVLCDAKLWSATGIFPAIDAEFSTRPTPLLVNPAGRVMRRSTNGALTFTLDWTGDLSLKHVVAQRVIGGRVIDELSPESLEFHELFNRHPPGGGYLPQVKQELDRLSELVESEQLPDSRNFTYRACFGMRAGQDFSPERMCLSGDDVMRSVHALSFLNVPTESQWSVAADRYGHIRYDDPELGEIALMAWSSNDYSIRDMEADLSMWARQASVHPNMIAFVQGRGVIKHAKPSNYDYRFTTPQPVSRSITEATVTRNVYLFNLGEIESLYDQVDDMSPEEFLEDIMQRRNRIDGK
ncbi:ABC-three component system protein [Pseudomonas putida]|uniref:ABC-three component system protein n=1 Tax=Pseudomonas putida TaxID=303 RepID=UPI0023637B04|nr:ABC-three component system protein [Pseudomonas putida]MDD1987674.1 ATPase [Pseudomonas putida]HDS1792746.1 ATPase [Pseudomonas putida]